MIVILAQNSTSVLPFLEFDAAATYDTARVVILPIAYEATTTHRKDWDLYSRSYRRSPQGTAYQLLRSNDNVNGYDVMELAPVVDSVVSQFTAAKLVYKIIGYQALAKGWFNT